MTSAIVAALAALLVIDYLQTVVIARPGGPFERNPLLAPLIRRFGVNAVHFWFACAGIALALLYMNRFEYTLHVLVVWCAAEVACVLNNYRLGIRP